MSVISESLKTCQLWALAFNSKKKKNQIGNKAIFELHQKRENFEEMIFAINNRHVVIKATPKGKLYYSSKIMILTKIPKWQ